MCVHAVALFSCRHEIWGRRTSLCTISEDFRAGLLEADCTLRNTHPLKTMKMNQPCYNCFKIKALPMLCREKLQEARSAFKERWPEDVSSDRPGTNEIVKGEDKESEQPGMDIKENVVDATPSVVAKPKTIFGKVPNVSFTPKTNATTTPVKGTGLATPKVTPASQKSALPAPKTTPPKVSRLALPTRKTPEKSTPAPKASTQSTPKVLSKLPKPGFVRK